MNSKLALFGSLAVLLVSVHAFGVEPSAESRRVELRALTDRMKYQQGKIVLQDGLATVNLSPSFRYVDPAGTETLLTGIWGNPPSEKKPLGMIVPAGFDPTASDAWCVIISYEDDGYVKDNDAEKIDYTKMLKEMKEATHEANTQRVKDGYDAMELVGWATPPRYDKQTHKFFWAKELKFGEAREGNTLNYSMRILGRKGILELNAVAGMSQFPQIEKATPQILSMVDFNAGQSYADYKPGTDKLATYGLAALVAGGIAAKAGLFKGLIVALIAMKKFVIVGAVAASAYFKKLFRGKKDTTIAKSE